MTNSWCVLDKPLGFSKHDTDETIIRNTDHDKRWYSVCDPKKFKELFPEDAHIVEGLY